MEKQARELDKWLKDVESFDLPSYKELPNIELYMEQVLKYINSVLAPFSFDGSPLLTSYMVNNYVKAKMISEPKKKRYTKEQLGYLIAITIMKSSLSMGDMSLLLELDDNISLDTGRIYAFYSEMETSIVKQTTSVSKKQVDKLLSSFDKAKAAGNGKADEDLRNSLGLLALRLATKAEANKLLSDRIIDALRKDMHGPEAIELEITPAPHEVRRENKISASEATRLAAAKNKEKESLEPKKPHKEKKGNKENGSK